MTLAVLSALMCVSAGAEQAPPSQPASPGPSDAALTKILDSHRTVFVKCIDELDQTHPEPPPVPENQPPAANAAEAKARYEASVKALEESSARLKGEKACTVAFHKVVDPKLTAAGASPKRGDQLVSKWFQAFWKARDKKAAPPQ